MTWPSGDVNALQHAGLVPGRAGMSSLAGQGRQPRGTVAPPRRALQTSVSGYYIIDLKEIIVK
jgi:hypothetical protein